MDKEKVSKSCECGGEYEFLRYCGVDVCEKCDKHRGLTRCFCGWSESGGDGRQELEEMGETIEEDDAK
jgi:hypothetical protein